MFPATFYPATTESGRFRQAMGCLGATLVAALVGLVLLILTCACQKFVSISSSSSDARERAGADSAEPSVVVVMPGSETPTCLAKPLSNSSH
ncbi:hypothetical protein C1H46_039754 [Malus baccata]|uniref:Uncharacterized protein n=1 Tax=Malus baccata TaxID=106549 RepID=A0A540KKJ4_MALBA|nr:hypothetical protein C1H46_039754 [Malus baccata]